MIEYLKKLFSCPDLIYHLTAKDFKVRYKTATLGFLWTILNPLLLMMILTIVFSIIIKIDVDKFPVFLLCGLLPWTFTSLSLSASTTSIVDSANLVKKVSFPRAIIPLSVVIANFINFMLSMIILFIFLLLFRVHLGWSVVLLPIIICIHFIFVTGLSLIAAAAHIHYRDVKYIVEALLLCWFYLTPIFYPISLVPQRLHNIYMLNPMAGFVTLYRNILLYDGVISIRLVVYIAIVTLLCFISGLAMFKRDEKTFADFI